MAIYRRKEYFRFEFNPPIRSIFKISKLDQESVESSEGEAKIVDISSHGMKIETPLHLPTDREIELTIHFKLNQQDFIVPGKLIWNKGVSYGVHLLTAQEVQKQLLKEIRQFAAARKKQG